MQTKTLKTLVLVFVLFLILIAVKIYLPKLTGSKPSPYLERVKQINTDSLSKLEFSKEGSLLKFAKSEGTWRVNPDSAGVNGKKADEEKIKTLLSQVVISAKPTLISESSALHGDYEITASQAAKVKIGDSLTFLVGKSNPDGTYIRFDETDAVYLLADTSYLSFSADANDWYDKKIVKIAEADLKKITVAAGSSTYSLVKNDTSWKIETSDKEPDKEKITSFLSRLNPLTASNLADEKEISDFPQVAAFTLSFEHSGGKETLSFFKGEEEYLVNRDSDKEQFIISESLVSDFPLQSGSLM